MSMPTERMKIGAAAEEAVCRHLISAGYRILDRNWRRPWGELDVVAQQGGVVHFVEVKASSLNREGFAPTVRADWRKMAKVKRTAHTWLIAHRYQPDTEWCLTVASVIMDPSGPVIELLPV